MIQRAYKTISAKNEFPAQPHFAAIEFDSIYIPGDERSRTNPGHGYPASSEPISRYISFENKEAMLAWVQEREFPKFGSAKKNYQIIESFPQTINIKITLDNQ
jgi:hypothetical protein